MPDEGWEDRYGEPPDLPTVVFWSEDNYFAFWDEENPSSPIAVVDGSKIKN